MTPTEEPRRPWWKRPRWVVAGLLWAAVLYPASFGPAKYLLFRDATPAVPFASIFRAVYAPLRAVVRGTPLEGPLDRYESWAAGLAARHDGRDRPPVIIIPPYPRPDLPE